ncbi:hypothetical protein B0H11DRAFT_2242157 [Mycena galericulata]|nr:hypothetical protein B0H11DRAFT_2242157 [Mycena galericulata]
MRILDTNRVLIANTPVAEHDRINALGQCSGCGNTSARLSTEYCGLCEKKNVWTGAAPTGPKAKDHTGLIRWGIVIHGFIDGYSRIITGLRASITTEAALS